MGWLGKTNGELLSLAEAQFDAFITFDTNFVFQQPIAKFRLRYAVLRSYQQRGADLQALAKSNRDMASYVGAGGMDVHLRARRSY